jgi:hypothetical protein
VILELCANAWVAAIVEPAHNKTAKRLVANILLKTNVIYSPSSFQLRTTHTPFFLRGRYGTQAV